MFILSLILFVPAALLFSVPDKPRWQRVLFAVVLILYTLLLAGYYAINYFTGCGITPGAVYTLRYGLEGAGIGAYPSLIAKVAGGLLAGIAFWHFCELRRAGARLFEKRGKGIWMLGTLLFAASVIINPALRDLRRMAYGQSAGGIIETGEEAPPPSPSTNTPLPPELEFRKVYRQPEITKAPEHPLNIVYIYGESLERTYLDERLFPGLMPNIKKLEEQGTRFTNISQLPEAWWTMGGMVASQCGAPLSLYSGRNSFSALSDFMGGATCMGDLLKTRGYSLSYLGGAELSFAGKGNFYASHGFTDVAGLRELKSSLPDPQYTNSWGLYDDTLFDTAYARFNSLSKAGKPFGLFMITMDTHTPGYMAKSCGDMKYGDGKDTMLNALHCDDKLIGDFIDRMRTSPYGKDTVIALGSDHISMNNSVYQTLEKGDRKNLFLILSPDGAPRSINRHATTFDIGPTVLDAMGYKAELGLGRDMFGEDSVVYKTSMARGGFPRQWLDASHSFWPLPKAREITADTRAGAFSVNGKRMALPVLMELRPDGQDRYYFPVDMPDLHTESYLARFAPDSPYIYIDQCANTAGVSGGAPKKFWCVAAGKLGSSRGISMGIDGKFRFNAKMLDELFALPTNAAAYRENLSRLTEGKLHPRVRAMLDALPEGATVYLKSADQSVYATAYLNIRNKKINLISLHTDAVGKKFYAPDYELHDLQDAKFRLKYEPAKNSPGLIYVTDFEIKKSADKLLANTTFSPER
jgi:phosphoglycerol transferase